MRMKDWKPAVVAAFCPRVVWPAFDAVGFVAGDMRYATGYEPAVALVFRDR